MRTKAKEKVIPELTSGGSNEAEMATPTKELTPPAPTAVPTAMPEAMAKRSPAYLRSEERKMNIKGATVHDIPRYVSHLSLRSTHIPLPQRTRWN